MKKYILFIPLSLFIILVYKYWINRVVEPIQVKVYKVTQGEVINFISTTGSVKPLPDADVNVTARVSAAIDKVLVKEGDNIEKGAPLVFFDQIEFEYTLSKNSELLKEVEIEIGEIEAEKKLSVLMQQDPMEGELLLKEKEDNYNQALLNLSDIEAKLKASKVINQDPTESELFIKEKQTNYELAIIKRTSAERNLDVSQQLYKAGAGSKFDYEDKKALCGQASLEEKQVEQELKFYKENYQKQEKTNLNIQSLQGQCNKVLIQKEQAQRELDLYKDFYQKQEKTKFKKQNLEAKYNKAFTRKKIIEEEIKYAKTNLENSKVISPLSGTIIFVSVKEGAYVTRGQSLITIIVPDKLCVSANVDQSDISMVKHSQKVIIGHETFLGKAEIMGKVVKIAPQALVNEKGSTVEITIEANDNGVKKIKIGSQVYVKIITQSHSNVLFIPWEAIKTKNVDQYVNIFENGLAVARKIETGEVSNIDFVEVKEGLQKGEIVIIPGEIDISDGQKVEIKNK